MASEWVLLGISVLLVFACGIFVAGEFALLTADRLTVEREAEEGDRRAQGVLAAFGSLSTQLSGVQIAITLTNLAIGFLSEPAIAGLLDGPLESLGISGGAVDVVAVIIALVVSTVLTMVLGELVPKNLAIALPVATAKAVQAPVRLFTTIMSIPIRVFNRLADLILSLFGMQAQEELASARSPDELLSLVRHSARKGTLAQGTATLLVRSLTFGDKRARDVLTPRPRMVTVPADAYATDALDLVRETGRSRLPVTGPDGLDDIVGLVELDQVVRVPAADRASTPIRMIMAPIVEVPETLYLDDVLENLRSNRAQVAIVVDEYGGTAGLLTGEDLLEELVGELDDEHDTPGDTAQRVGDGFDVSGLMRPDEVAASTGHRLPAHGVYETVGGLAMQALGRIPVEGDRVVIDGVALTVTRMDGNRVDRLLLTVEEPGS